MPRTAVVLFNLGGPDTLAAVRPFLFNLFHDPAIIRLPQPMRWLVAQIISRRRAAVAQEIYALLGGASPILPNTEAQAAALADLLGSHFKVFVAMRYWRPRAAAQIAAVKAWQPERVVLLPLYPQYSTTTTRSSIEEWLAEARRAGLDIPFASVCCWPRATGFIRSVVALIAEAISKIAAPYRLLFSAHGLPKRIVADGDPYQWQVEWSAAAAIKLLDMPDLDWSISYQSRVGPMEWIGPSTEEEIRRAAREGLNLIVVPLTFVSEHSETLVELDQEYGSLAKECGIEHYLRVETVSVSPDFIQSLAAMVRNLAEITDSGTMHAFEAAISPRLCPPSFKQCLFGKELR